MFALLLSDKMDPFYQNIGSFPTLVFSFLLGACLIYWIFSVLGIVDLNLLHFNVELSGPEVDVESLGAIAGFFVRFGLAGVPLIITLSFISLIGWLISFTLVHFLFLPISDSFWRYPAGVLVLVGAGYIAIRITAYLIRPLRKVFEKSVGTDHTQLIGKIVVVRTSRVDDGFGEAVLEDGGAGLVLQVRSADGEPLTRGDRAVLLEYETDNHQYRIILESRFTSEDS